MKVLGKHSRGGKREEAYGMFGAVSAFKAMKAARSDAIPELPQVLFKSTIPDCSPIRDGAPSSIMRVSPETVLASSEGPASQGR